MRDALARVFGSAKVWTAIIGLIVTFGATAFARWGIEVSDAAVQQTAITVSAIFAILLGAQGATDHGKAAAQIAATTTTKTTVEPGDPPTVVEEKTSTEPTP